MTNKIACILLDFLACILLTLYEIFISFWQFFIQFIKPNYKSLDNEIVLITGAASGLGRMLSIDLATKGCIVIGIDVNEKGLLETKDIVKKETNKEFYLYVCDIRFKENIINLQKRVEKDVGFVDILINNAGIVHGQKLLDLKVDEIKETFDVNVFSNYYMVQVFLPRMLKRSHGHIVFVSSFAGYVSGPFLADYCASKAAVNMFAETLLTELKFVYKDPNIRVTTATPFLMDTGMFSGCKSRISFLFPFLTPCYVSNKIVEAIMKNQIHLSIGRLNYFIYALKSIFSVNAIYEIYKFAGGHTFLDGFINNRELIRRQNYEETLDIKNI